MTVGELIDYLGQYDEDAQVRVAYQPGYPLRAKVVSVIAQSEIYAEELADTAEEYGDEVVWIATDSVGGAEDPYAPTEAWSGS